MNAALLMMTCCLAGGEKPQPQPAPAPAPVPAPIVIQSLPAAGCTNCAPGICKGSADPQPEESKTGFLTKLKGRVGGRKKDKDGGDCAGCGGGAYASAPSDSGKSGGFLSRLKARLGGKKNCAGPCASGCDTGCGGCGAFGAPGGMILGPTAPGGEGPKQMEKGKDPKMAGTFPYGPLTPVAGPALPPPPPLATARSPF